MRKVRGRLWTTSQARLGQDITLRRLEPPTTPAGRLRVTVRLERSATIRSEDLARAGFEVERVPLGSNLMRGTIHPDDLPRVAALPGVASVAPLDLAVNRIGSALTEGDAGSGADLVRAQGLDGTGITVGVISNGIDTLQTAQATGDLGSVTVPADSRCQHGNGDEGTALLEIVHDLAPGARLLFSGAADNAEMIDSVACLTDAGADVIVDDLGFFAEPYFEDGPVAAAVQRAVSLGVSYHSAAGNEAGEHLETEYRASPSTSYHDFDGGMAVDNTQTTVIPPGGVLPCVLQWDDPFGASGNDYDLFLLDASLSVVDFSVGVQDGDGDPIEFAAVVNPTASSQLVHVAIDRYAGVPRRLKMYCFGGTDLQYVTPGGSIFGHPALPGVVAVGAVDQAEPGRDDVESFSSQGPARILFPAITIRQKPDIAALDGVSISNAGGFPLCPPFCRFFGTSAAAPHSAGVAALLLQRAPTLSPQALLSALQAGAVDIESPGRDVIAGAGRLNAIASLALVSPATTTSTVTTTTTTSSTLASAPSTSLPTVVPTTTSTMPPNLACTRRCPDDGDECTTEVCEAGAGCRSNPVERAEGVICLLDRLAAAQRCEAGAMTPRLAASIGKKILKAKAHAARTIGAAPKRHDVHVHRTLVLLRALSRKLAVAHAAGRIEPSCHESISTALARVRSLAEITRF